MNIYRTIFLRILLVLTATSCAVVQNRSTANIFYEDDRISMKRESMPNIGSVHYEKSFETIIGTAFLVDHCHIATNYHLVRDTSTKMKKDDHLFYLAGDEKNFIKAVVVDHGKPYSVTKSLRANEDWALLKLSKCSGANPFSLKVTLGNQILGREKLSVSLYGFPRDKNIDFLTTDPHCSAYFPISKRGLLHDCAVRKGNSGGPILSSHGEVVAIQSEAAMQLGDSFAEFSDHWANIACPISPVIKALKNLKPNHQ